MGLQAMIIRVAGYAEPVFMGVKVIQKSEVLFAVLFMPSMLSQDFTATLDEIELAACLLRTTARQSTGMLSRDAAIRILKESELSYKQIREIWTIADRGGSGKLSKDELTVVIRLAGWVQQRGAAVNEELLVKAGPLPVLKGIPYIPQRKREEPLAPHLSSENHNLKRLGMSTGAVMSPVTEHRPFTTGVNSFDGRNIKQSIQAPQLPPITFNDMENFKLKFEMAGPVCGLLDKETVVEVFLGFDLPYSIVDEIINLVQSCRRCALNLPEFTLAMHFVMGVKSNLIRTLPSRIPQELYNQVGWMLTSPTLAKKAGDCSSTSTETSADERSASASDNYTESIISDSTTSTTSWASVESTPRPRHRSKMFRFAPLRKERSAFSSHSPSMETLEHRGLSAFWQRVAKRCHSIRTLPASLKKCRKTRQTESSSNDSNSILVTVSTATSSSSSFDAISDLDTWISPRRGQRVPLERTQLPLIFPSQFGYYPPASSPYARPNGTRWQDDKTVASDFSTSQESINQPSDFFWTPITGPSEVEKPSSSKVSLENGTKYQRYGPYFQDKGWPSQAEIQHHMSKGLVQRSREPERRGASTLIGKKSKASKGDNVLELIKDIMEGHDSLRSQVRIMHKSVEKLYSESVSSDESIDFIADGLEESSSSNRASPPISRMVQSLAISKQLQGPRDMLSSVLSTGSPSSMTSCSESSARKTEPRPPAPPPKLRDRRGIVHFKAPKHTGTVISDSMRPDGPRIPLPLRSILKVKTAPPIPTQMDWAMHNKRKPAGARSIPSSGKGKGKEKDNHPATADDTLESWNAKFIFAEEALRPTSTHGSRHRPLLPRLPLHEVNAPVVPIRSTIPSRKLPLPTLHHLRIPSVAYGKRSDMPDPEPSSPDDDDSSSSSTFRESSSPFSTSRSSTAYSQQFSPRSSARTTLVADIEDFNENVVNDLKKAAPILFLQVKKCLLRELRTESLRHSSKYAPIFDIDSDDIERVTPFVIDTQSAKEIDRLAAELASKNDRLKRLEDEQAVLLRHYEAAMAKAQEEAEELRRRVENQRDPIPDSDIWLNLVGTSPDLFTMPPTYNESCSSSYS